jgi:Protein of unknown function (DUF3298)/Deacetylase PdaC
MKPLFVFIFAILSCALTQDELFNDSSYQKFFYLGTVNDNQVQMTLELRGKEVIGTYYYNIIGTPIELRGKQTGEATDTGLPLIVEELDENGKAVAKFEGELSSTYQEIGTTFNGTWSYDGCADPTPKPFKLGRVAEFARASFQQNRIETALTFPVFLGDLTPFNEAIKQNEIVNSILNDFKQGQDEQVAGNLYYAWTVHSHYTIRYASKNLVSLLETGDWYTGGAHGNFGFADHTFLQKDGKVERLEFRDLFAENADLSPLATFVKDDLSNQEASFIPEDFNAQSLEDLSAFTLSPKGITFHFAPYAVGSYAEGDYEVTVPFEEVKDRLRSEIAAEFLE